MPDIINIIGADEKYNLKRASSLKRKYEAEGKITYIVYSQQNYARCKLYLPSAHLIIVVGMSDILPFILSDTGARSVTTLKGE